MPHLNGLMVAVAWALCGAPAEASPAPIGPAETAPTPSMAKAPTAAQMLDMGRGFEDGAAYDSAIAIYTKALEQTYADPKEAGIRRDVVLALGHAHSRAYEIDHDPEHLRRARDIYAAFMEEDAEPPGPDTGSSAVSVASEHSAIVRLLEIHEAELAGVAATAERDARTPPPSTDVSPQAPQQKKLRGGGLASLITGSAMFITGASLIGFGATFEPAARSTAGDPDTDTDAANFIENERKKGVVFMASGGVVAAIGTGAVVLGAVLLHRSRSPRPKPVTALRFSPSVGPDRVGIALYGRF